MALFIAASPARAETYKWVDERGVVTYSNTPPAAGTQPKKVEAVAERVSVYTPDPELYRAMQVDPRRDAKIASLEWQLEMERRRAAPSAPAPQSSAYERCAAERRVDCEALRYGTAAGYPAEGYAGYYAPAYVYGVVRGAVLMPPQPFYVLNAPAPRIGVDNRPPVGIDNRPPVGAPPRNRAVGMFRQRGF